MEAKYGSLRGGWCSEEVRGSYGLVGCKRYYMSFCHQHFVDAKRCYISFWRQHYVDAKRCYIRFGVNKMLTLKDISCRKKVLFFTSTHR